MDYLKKWRNMIYYKRHLIFYSCRHLSVNGLPVSVTLPQMNHLWHQELHGIVRHLTNAISSITNTKREMKTSGKLQECHLFANHHHNQLGKVNSF